MNSSWNLCYMYNCSLSFVILHTDGPPVTSNSNMQSRDIKSFCIPYARKLICWNWTRKYNLSTVPLSKLIIIPRAMLTSTIQGEFEEVVKEFSGIKLQLVRSPRHQPRIIGKFQLALEIHRTRLGPLTRPRCFFSSLTSPTWYGSYTENRDFDNCFYHPRRS